jgi:hypothetical protein
LLQGAPRRLKLARPGRKGKAKQAGLQGLIQALGMVSLLKKVISTRGHGYGLRVEQPLSRQGLVAVHLPELMKSGDLERPSRCAHITRMTWVHQYPVHTRKDGLKTWGILALLYTRCCSLKIHSYASNAQYCGESRTQGWHVN